MTISHFIIYALLWTEAGTYAGWEIGLGNSGISQLNGPSWEKLSQPYAELGYVR